MNSAQNADYLQFKALADRAIRSSSPAPASRTISRIVTREPSETSLLRNLSVRSTYCAISAFASLACLRIRDFISVISRSDTAANRRKYVIMCDYLNASRRVPFLLKKVNDIIFRFYNDQVSYISYFDRFDFSGSDVSHFDRSALMDEAVFEEIDPFMKRLDEQIRTTTRDMLRPIDAPVMARCFFVITAIEMLCTSFASISSGIDSDCYRMFSRLCKVYKPFIELLNELGMTDREGRRYLWLCNSDQRSEWRNAVIKRKKYLHGHRITSLHPIDTGEAIRNESVFRIDYELTKHLFTISTIDRICRKFTGSNPGFIDHFGRDNNIVKCIQNYDQFRLFVSCVNYDIGQAISIAESLPDSVKSSFIAAFDMSSNSTAEFIGCWFSASDASSDTGTDVYEIVDIASLNTEPWETARSYNVDSFKIAFFGYDMFLSDLRRNFKIIKDNNLHFFKIQPVESPSSPSAPSSPSSPATPVTGSGVTGGEVAPGQDDLTF